MLKFSWLVMLVGCQRTVTAMGAAAAVTGGAGGLFYGCQQCPAQGPCPPVAVGGAAATGGASSTGGAVAAGGTTAQTQEQAACANLHRLGCPEAADVTQCAADMQFRCANPKVQCNTPCLVTATSKAVVINNCKLACGSL